MKICFVSSEYPPENPHGGISTFTSATARALADAGHSVHVITWGFSADYWTFGNVTRHIDEKVMVHRVVMPPPRLHHRAFMWMPYRLLVLKEILSIRDLGVVQSPDNNADGLFLGLGRIRPEGPRLITWCIGTPTFTMKQLPGRVAPHGLYRLLSAGIGAAEKAQILSSDALLSCTEVSARITARQLHLDPESITVIPCGIELQRIRAAVPASGKLPDDYILYVGRLEARKGVHVLAKALKGVFTKHPSLRMVFIGNDTPFLDSTMARFILKVNQEFTRNIVLMGHQPEDIKKEAIRKARCVVCPSLSEGFGYSALEAMALGRTVIATRWTGLSELIEDGKSGLLVRPGEAQELADAMNYCLEHDIAPLERGARERSELFEIRKLLPRYERFYDGVATIN